MSGTSPQRHGRGRLTATRTRCTAPGCVVEASNEEGSGPSAAEESALTALRSGKVRRAAVGARSYLHALTEFHKPANIPNIKHWNVTNTNGTPDDQRVQIGSNSKKGSQLTDAGERTSSSPTLEEWADVLQVVCTSHFRARPSACRLQQTPKVGIWI